MYNVIVSDTKCPKCGADMGEWQSKELCIRGKYYIQCDLQTIGLEEDMSGEMHNFCDKCDAMVDIEITNGNEGKPVWKKVERPWLNEKK